MRTVNTVSYDTNPKSLFSPALIETILSAKEVDEIVVKRITNFNVLSILYVFVKLLPTVGFSINQLLDIFFVKIIVL